MKEIMEQDKNYKLLWTLDEQRKKLFAEVIEENKIKEEERI